MGNDAGTITVSITLTPDEVDWLERHLLVKGALVQSGIEHADEGDRILARIYGEVQRVLEAGGRNGSSPNRGQQPVRRRRAGP